MHIILQHSDLEHRSRLAMRLQGMGDMVHPASTLAEAVAMSRGQKPEGLVLEHSAEAMDIARDWTAASRSARAVVLAPRELLSDLTAGHPEMNFLPLPGTAHAIRCLLSPDPATDAACQIGDFQLTEVVALGNHTHIFKALQSSIHRPVRLRLLNTEYEADEVEVAEFLNNARAKAAVNHDRIGSVYQALESEGCYFYAAEEIDGPDLAAHAASHAPYSAEFAIDVLRTVASALHTLDYHGLMARRLEPRHIHLSGHHATPRIDNPVVPGPAPAGHHAAQFQHFAQFFLDHTSAGIPANTRLRAKLAEIAAAPAESLDMQRLVGEFKHLQDHPAGKSSMAAGAEPASKSMRPLVVVVAALALVFLVFLFGSGRGGGNGAPVVRPVENPGGSVVMPGGRFEHPVRGGLEISPYSIDIYETTIRDYARFLEYVAQHGDAAVRHPEQPPTKASFVPDEWEVFYPAAKGNGRYRDAAITLDCPVFNVDFWDASAYAKWQNRRLPTEDEWEAASRRDGDWSRFPWGGEADPEIANTRDKPGPIRGFRLWCPVDMPGSDRTLQGVFNLGGNVSEWTSSETVHPDFPDRRIPIVKGGSFAVNAGDSETFNRRKVLSPGERHVWLGIRTVGQAPSQTTDEPDETP